MVMARYNITGFCVPPLTPFDDNGRLNIAAIPAYAKWLQEQGMEHVFVAGTSGEGPSLTMDEHKQLAEAWLQQSQQGTLKTAVIHIGVGGNVQYECELAMHAEQHGAHAIACLSPYYYRPPNAIELADYLAIVAAAAPKTPFLYYHFPDFTNVRIPLMEIFEACSKTIPTFSGCKYTDWNTEEACEIQRRFPDTIVMPGRDQAILQSLAMGMKPAWISAGGNWYGKRYNGIIRAFGEGNLDEARRLQSSVTAPFWTTTKLKLNMFPAMRVWLEHASGGRVLIGKPRPPLPALNDQQRNILIAEFDESDADKREVTVKPKSDAIVYELR